MSASLPTRDTVKAAPMPVCSMLVNAPAAIAGIVFSLLLVTALVLVRVSVPARSDDPGTWLRQGGHRGLVVAALGLVPFAGIAIFKLVG